MRSTTCWIKVMLVSAGICLAGCQSWPESFTQGVDTVTISAKTRDAHLDHVQGHPGLRFDDALRDRLHAVMSSEDLSDIKQTGDEVLRLAHQLALHTVHNEIDQLSLVDRQALHDHYFPDDISGTSDVWTEYVRRSDTEVKVLRDNLRNADDLDAVHAVLRPIVQGLETPLKDQGRFARMAPWLMVTPVSLAAIDNIYNEEYHGNADVPFASATVYDINGTAGSGDWPAPSDAELLKRFAPIIVQEDRATDATYRQEVDLIGHPTTPDRETVVVQTDRAAVYAYMRTIYIQDRPHRQLTYTHWYPEHPALKPDDPEAGRVEGVTLRITLDANDRPAIFETVYNCGCYHRLYPSEALEARARGQYGKPLDDKTLSIERAVDHKKDLIVPNAVQVSKLPSASRPVIRVRAGWHGIVDVGYQVQKYNDETHSRASYMLEPYEALERTHTTDGQVTSIFYDNGLVKQAQRPEGVFFTPAGLLSAGQPRQRGTQLIHWDNWNFDDPHLFERALRLPDGF